MDDANKDDIQVKEEKEVKEENANTTGKIYVKQLHQILENPSKNTSDDVQRAIKGLREIPAEHGLRGVS